MHFPPCVWRLFWGCVCVFDCTACAVVAPRVMVQALQSIPCHYKSYGRRIQLRVTHDAFPELYYYQKCKTSGYDWHSSTIMFDLCPFMIIHLVKFLWRSSFVIRPNRNCLCVNWLSWCSVILSVCSWRCWLFRGRYSISGWSPQIVPGMLRTCTNIGYEEVTCRSMIYWLCPIYIHY